MRLIHERNGALIVVEDAESSSEVSLSPMVRRLAEVQGGWAKVAPGTAEAAAFQVFLPGRGTGRHCPTEPAEGPERAGRDESRTNPNHWVKAEQALVAELRELSQGKANSR